MPTNDNEQFSSLTGFLYTFNLIVGTGALTLPGAVKDAGWFLGIIMVSLLGLVSLVTVTFILETLAIVNALTRKDGRTRALQIISRSGVDEENEDTPLVAASEVGECDQTFDILEKFEIGEMGSILLSKPVKIFIFLCLVIYLCGDLAIYNAVIGKTLAHVFCTYKPLNYTCNIPITDDTVCWENSKLTRTEVYRIFVCCFVLLIGPFVFFNIQKTKLLQILTSVMRWVAFLIMISWSIQKLIVFGRKGFPPFIRAAGLPTLFGSCVYSFMCQHSIPGLVMPIANKLTLKKSFTYNYILIALFYLLLALTAVFTFSHVEDLYSLNFWSDACNPLASKSVLFLDYYLALFPVFTLSASFPVIAITLRNNLKNIFAFDHQSGDNCYTSYIFPIVTVTVPAILALTISDLQILVGTIGSFAGTAVQYLIPCILVVAARSHYSKFSSQNPYSSPFSAKFWVYLVYVWMTICVILISYKYGTDLINWYNKH